MKQHGGYGIDLYWLPLGARGNFVRINGRIYEAIAAALERRPRYDLYDRPPAGGRAPGWHAGLVAAARDTEPADKANRPFPQGVWP